MSYSEEETTFHYAKEKTTSMEGISLPSHNPRSSIRHRPIHTDDIATEIPSLPRVQRASRVNQTASHLIPASQPAKSTTADFLNARRTRTDQQPYQYPKTEVALPSPTKNSTKKTDPVPIQLNTARRRSPWLVFLGLGMMLALIAVLGAQFLFNWGNTLLDNYRYGMPRTSQIDAFVGHEHGGKTPSHFIAINLHGQIKVIEMPGGDSTHLMSYMGPQLVGQNADLIPATLSFIDTKHNHLPDMVLQAGSIQMIFHNDGNTYTPA